MMLSVLFCLALMLISGCSSQTYKHSLNNDQSFSFEYSRNDRLFNYPYDFLIESAFARPVVPDIGKNAIIEVFVLPKFKGSHIDYFYSYMSKNEAISNFDVYENGSVVLDSQTANYVKFKFDAYDTNPISFHGIFVSLVYQDNTIDVILSSTGNKAFEKAYQLFVKTFKIIK
jgi:hypothetical protein